MKHTALFAKLDGKQYVRVSHGYRSRKRAIECSQDRLFLLASECVKWQWRKVDEAFEPTDPDRLLNWLDARR